MYSRVVKVTKEIVKKGISVGICLAMLLPILPLNFSFIMNTEKEAKAGLATAPDYQTSKGDPNSYVGSDVRTWLNNGLATSVPDSGTEAPTGKNYKLDSTATSDNTSGYAKSAFPDNEDWSKLTPFDYWIPGGDGSHHRLKDKIFITSSVNKKIGGQVPALMMEPEGTNEEGYSLPWDKLNNSSGNYVSCRAASADSTKVSGFNNMGTAQDVAVNASAYVNPIINLEHMSQIVCAPTIAELQSNGGSITRTLTASSSARMCFFMGNDASDINFFENAIIVESGRVGFCKSVSNKTCVAMAMKKIRDENNKEVIETITSSSGDFSGDIQGYWIDFGKTKEDLKEYVFYAWLEDGGGKYATANYMTGVYWKGDNLAVAFRGDASELDGFKGIVFGNSTVGYEGKVPFGNRTWRYLGEHYFVQEQPENVVFNSSTAGYGGTQTEINLSDELRNGIELTTTGSPVEIPTDGITLTGFPANGSVSFLYREADDSFWREGTPTDAGTYYVIVCVWSEGFEPKYSPAFLLTAKEGPPAPVYEAPTTQIEAVWRDKAKDKLPSDLADYFGYPKTASGANILGTWALVDENAEVGNVDGSNRPIGKFTPDPSVLGTYNWAGLSGWNATEGRLEVPALFTVAPMPADRLSCAQLSSWSLEYDGRPKSWRIRIWVTNGNRHDYLGYENYDVVWPEDMTNAGTKTYTVNLKNNCTGTLTGAVEISKRQIRITADNQTICYGDQLPQLTWKQSGEGFVGSGSLIEGTVAVEESGNYPGPGNYNIIPSGFSTNDPTNYEVSHVNGTLAVGTDTFEITPRKISNATVTVTPASSAYTGGVHTPSVVLTDILNGVTKTLTLNTDYTLKWLSNMTNAGEQQGTATGQGNYQGTTDIAYEITPRQITITPESKSQVYGAAEVPLGYTVKDTNTGETLNIKSELTGSLATAQTGENGMRWPNADKYTIGLGTLTSENNPNYLITLGSPVATYTITKKDVTSDSNVTVRVLSPTLPYTGQAPELELEVKDGDEILERGTDYTVEADGIEPGEHTVTITFIKNRTGTKEETYTIESKSTDRLRVELDKTKFTYNGWFRRPEVTVYDGNDIVSSSEYTLEFLNDVNVGTATAKATMSAKYGNAVLTKTYTIEKREPIVATYGDFVGNVLPKDQLETLLGSITYVHSEFGTVGDKVLGNWCWKDGEDYRGYGLTLLVGDATTGNETRIHYAVYAAGDVGPSSYLLSTGLAENHNGACLVVPIEFKVQPKALADDMLTMTESGTYTGSEIEPDITVKDGSTPLVLGKDYKVSYEGDRVNVGSFTAIITGIGNYQGSIRDTYTITKRNVNVTIDDKCKLQGTDDPVNTYTVTTEDTGEVLDDIELPLKREDGTALGNYVISLASTEHSNVNVVKVTNGTLTIGKNSFEILRRPTTVTAKNTSKTFGEADPKLEYSATNLVDEETLSGELTREEGEVTTKTYKILQGSVTNENNPNYDITFKEGTFTITAATGGTTNVTLGGGPYTFDGNEHKPGVTVTYNGTEVPADKYTVEYQDEKGGQDLTSAGTITVKVTLGPDYGNQEIEKTYTINRKPVTVTADDQSIVYGEAAQTLTYTTDTGDTLNGDLTRASGNNVGTYDITQGTVTNKNNPNYDITYVKGTYTITAAPITDSAVTLSSSSFTYDGSEKKPIVTVTVGGRTLTANTDYKLEFDSDTISARTVTLKVKGQNNYRGEVTKTYTIARKTVSDSTTDSKLGVTTGSTTFTYNGSQQKLEVQITYNGETWQEGVDYTKEYLDSNNGNDITNQGTKTLRVTFIKNLNGAITRTYTIERAPITENDVELGYNSVTYDGNAHPQTPTVTVGGRRLTVNTDYTVSGDTNPTDVSDSYSITVTGKGNYSGTVTKTFAINKKEVTDSKPNGITMSVKPVNGKVFNGQRQTPDEVILKDGAKLLIENVDYDLEYLTNMTDAITHKIKANLKGNYSGSKTADFIITPKQISDNTPESELKVDVDKTGHTDETGYIYDKTPKRPAVTIKAMFGNRTMQLVQGTHFDVNYLAENGTSDVTNVGSKKVVITFKNGFSGTRTIKYAINRRDVTIRANERRRYYKTPDPDMRPRTNYDTINGLIAGDNLYGSFEREDPTNEEVGRYKIIQGTTLTNANNPNYNIIFKNEENTAYFIIEVDKSSWGTPQDYPKDHYVDDEGKTSTEVDKYGMVWLRETSDGTSAWYGIDNSKAVFRIGSRFWVMWLSEKESPETYKKYWDMLDEDHKKAMEALNGWIFLIGVTDPDGEDYEKFSEDENGETDEEKIVPTYVQIGDDWDEDELVGVFISETEDEDIVTTFVNDFEFPEGLDTFGKMMLRHFSPYFIYDRDTERKALEGNDDEANVLRTTVDIKGKTVQIIVSGPRRVLPKGTKLIAVEDRNDNTCKIWLVDQSGKELPSPLSERVEVFIEMVDGMEDLIEVRLPKIGEDFHYGKFDGSWYGAIYTPYFPISLSLDELTDAERDELNKKRGLSGDKESGSDGGSSSSRNGSNAENDGQGDNETEELQPAENGSSNWWQNLSRTQIICLTAAGILLLLLLIFLILLILKRRKEKENSSQQ